MDVVLFVVVYFRCKVVCASLYYLCLVDIYDGSG